MKDTNASIMLSGLASSENFAADHLVFWQSVIAAVTTAGTIERGIDRKTGNAARVRGGYFGPGVH
jgi:hypothetical protein